MAGNDEEAAAAASSVPVQRRRVLAWWIAMAEATNCSFRNQEGNWE